MIEIICLNVRGLNKEEKRRNLFKTLKCDHRFQKYNLICLVETKFQKKIMISFSKCGMPLAFSLRREVSPGLPY